MKLAIIDLDGVIVNNDARFECAKAATGKIDWNIAFDPALVSLDIPVPGTKEALDFLESKGFIVCFLTSRPEHMRKATMDWLREYHFGANYRELFMKDYAVDRYTKTVDWKVRMVATSLHVKFYSEVLFIDDEEVNRAAVEALGAGIVCKADLSDYMDSDKPLIF